MKSQTKTYISHTPGLTSGHTLTQRYKIIEELGSGGMGTVYKVEDKEINEIIALKLLKRDIAADEKHIRRFQNELKFARKINHINVCQMYHLSRDKDNFFITMEYVRGEDLKSIIQMMGQMSAGKAIHIAKQVCLGLSAAHTHGVIHRDLKPQNIMIDKEGNARIMDFGIARSINAQGITVSGVMIGTPEYMSPEQVEGQDIDFRSDIYSLGIILYELLSGQSPFSGGSPLSVALKQKNETPVEPRKLNPQIPETLNQVILKCLEKDREQRYPSAKDLLSDLIDIEKNLPNTARIKSPRKTHVSKRIKATFSQKKRRTAAFIVLINSAVILAAFFLILKPPALNKRLPAYKQLTFTGTAFCPALAPDSRFFAYVEYRGHTRQDVVVQDLDNRQPLVVMSTRECKFLRWSPDSSLLSFWADTEDHGTGTFIIPLFGGSPYLLELEAVYLAWSPDGSQAAWINSEEKRIHILDYSTKNSTSFPLKETLHSLLDLDWSPIENSLLYLSLDKDDQCAIWISSGDGKNQRKIYSDRQPLYSPRWSSDGKAIYYLKDNRNFRELWKMPVSTSNADVSKSLTLVLSGLNTGRYFTLSRDGKKILFTNELEYANLWTAQRTNEGKNLRFETRQLTTGTLMNTLPSLSPDGHQIVFSRGERNQTNIYVMPVEGGVPQQISFLNSNNSGPVWSPDGKEIAFVSNHNQAVHVWNLKTRGGKPYRYSNTRLFGNNYSLTWSPGHNILYHKSNLRNYVVLDPHTEEEIHLIAEESAGRIRSPKYSPDGKKIAVYWERDDSRGIWVITPESLTQTQIHKGEVWPIGWSADGTSVYGFRYSSGGADILQITLEKNQTEILGTLAFNSTKYMRPSIHVSTNGFYFIFSVSEKNSDVVLVENFDPDLKN